MNKDKSRKLTKKEAQTLVSMVGDKIEKEFYEAIKSAVKKKTKRTSKDLNPGKIIAAVKKEEARKKKRIPA